MTVRNFTVGKLLLAAAFAAAIIGPACSLTGPDDSPPAKRGSGDAPEPAGKGKYPPAPKALADAELRTLDGGKIRIGDLKGKVVLINLWATWCAPCIEEMPYFVKMQEKYGSDKFVVLGLNSDEESEAQVREFVEEQELNYKIGWADEAVADEFMKISRLPGIPQSLLLNRKGEMTGMFRGGGRDVINKMVESVEKLMNEKKPETG